MRLHITLPADDAKRLDEAVDKEKLPYSCQSHSINYYVVGNTAHVDIHLNSELGDAIIHMIASHVENAYRDPTNTYIPKKKEPKDIIEDAVDRQVKLMVDDHVLEDMGVKYVGAMCRAGDLLLRGAERSLTVYEDTLEKCYERIEANVAKSDNNQVFYRVYKIISRDRYYPVDRDGNVSEELLTMDDKTRATIIAYHKSKLWASCIGKDLKYPYFIGVDLNDDIFGDDSYYSVYSDDIFELEKKLEDRCKFLNWSRYFFICKEKGIVEEVKIYGKVKVFEPIHYGTSMLPSRVLATAEQVRGHAMKENHLKATDIHGTYITVVLANHGKATVGSWHKSTYDAMVTGQNSCNIIGDIYTVFQIWDGRFIPCTAVKLQYYKGE